MAVILCTSTITICTKSFNKSVAAERPETSPKRPGLTRSFRWFRQGGRTEQQLFGPRTLLSGTLYSV